LREKKIFLVKNSKTLYKVGLQIELSVQTLVQHNPLPNQFQILYESTKVLPRTGPHWVCVCKVQEREAGLQLAREAGLAERFIAGDGARKQHGGGQRALLLPVDHPHFQGTRHQYPCCAENSFVHIALTG
jgi:hypothetical protein